MSEVALQTEILKYLRKRGCWAMKLKPGGGVPTGTADIFACKEGLYLFVEVKASKNAKVQLGQEPFIKKMHDWSWAKFIYPENWSEIKLELDSLLSD
jgi:Holliday junction resolvase